MFNVDFKDVLFQLDPHFLRKDNFLRFMFSGIKPLKTINNDGVLVESFGQKDASLEQFILFITNFLFFDARTIFLEKFLNDVYAKVTERWLIQKSYLIGDKIIFNAQNFIALTNNTGKQPDLNPSDWETTGIEIVNDNTISVLFLFNEAEEREDFFMYNNWDSTIAYIVDDFVVATDNKVYQANTNNTNEEPPNAKWDFIKDITFVFNVSDEFPFDYRIEIPLEVRLQPNYSNDRIKSQIRLFNAAGRTFEGVEKEDVTQQLFNSLT